IYKELEVTINFLNTANQNFEEAARILYNASVNLEEDFLSNERRYPSGKLGEMLIGAAKQYNASHKGTTKFFGEAFDIKSWESDIAETRRKVYSSVSTTGRPGFY